MADDTQTTTTEGDDTSTVTTGTTTDTSILDTATDDTGTSDTAADDKAADWRARMAGDDDKLLGFLGRYASEKAFVEAAKKDREAIRNKAVVKLPDNPTDAELAAYRKEQGIPEKPEEYLADLPNGLVVGDDDRPMVDKFLAKMHETNAPKGVTHAALEAYYSIVEDQVAEQSAAAAVAKEAGIEVLREEWGGDYKRNLNVVNGWLDTLPPPVRAAFVGGKDEKGTPFGGARMPDGTPLASNAELIKWFASQALEANPLATVVPGAGSNQASAISDEIARIEKVMTTDRKAYNADEKMQARYRELLTANEKLKGA